VEIISPSNTSEEMMEKKDLYFSKGTREFWLCDEDGNMAFYACRGQIDTSELFPQMETRIEAEA
jgi:Uma2 family endonuclease